MTFIFTAEDIQSLALLTIKLYKKEGYGVKVERPFEEDAPYRSTLVATNRQGNVLIEVQVKLNYHSGLEELARWINNKRKNCELYICVSVDTPISPSQLAQIKKDGVGIFSIDDNGRRYIIQKASNPSLIINIDPTLNFGKFYTAVTQAVKKFNEVDRKDGLRDLCEVFELAVEEVGVKMCRKGKFKTLTEEDYRKKDLSNKINLLATNDAYTSGSAPIDDTLKTDLHAFRNARNLFDHKVKRSEEKRRQLQCHDKMVLGARLIHELDRLGRKVK